jgi:hypothetical protein
LKRLASQAAEEIINFVIPSEERNLSSVLAHEKKAKFLVPFGTTNWLGDRSLFRIKRQ